jgi:hypothetical protein
MFLPRRNMPSFWSPRTTSTARIGGFFVSFGFCARHPANFGFAVSLK